MKRVLLVEDDIWQADIITTQLAKTNYNVSVAENALEAFDILDRTPPDVIVLDMMLPGPNGMTFLHEKQSHADIAQIPVIVCSTTMLDIELLRPYGVVAVLDKSTMQPHDISVAVRKALP